MPLFSCYESDYDRQGEADVSSLEGRADFYFCKWPVGMGSVSEYFLSLNGSRIKEYDGPVITLSHFLPRRELLPAVERLSFRWLPLVAGTLALDRQIRALNAVTHVFGHSHIDFGQVIEGVRYIPPLCPFFLHQKWRISAIFCSFLDIDREKIELNFDLLCIKRHR